MSSRACTTCEASNKKCDRTWGPSGCRRCAQAGLECGGYPSERIPRPKHSIRDQEHQLQPRQHIPTETAIPTHFTFPASSKQDNHLDPSSVPDVTSALDPSTLNIPSGSADYSSADLHSLDPLAVVPAVQLFHGHQPHGSITPLKIPTPQTEPIFTPATDACGTTSNRQDASSTGQMPTPPSEDSPPRGGVRRGGLMPISQANLFQSPVAFDTDPVYSTRTANLSSSAGVNLNSRIRYMSNNAREPLRLQFSTGAVVGSGMFDEEDDIDAENLELLRMKLLDGLVLDREIESNTISFLVHSFTSWMSRFLFEPARVIPLFREVIVRGHTLGHEKHQRLILTASAVLTVSESTNYDPAPFTDLYNQSVKGVVEARARGSVTREIAIEAMESCHEVISLMCKICSLASILNTMDLYAPIFRLACPEPGHEYVNLPGILTGFQVHLKLYATMDVLLSAVTHRPMFFRYDLDPASPQAEALLNAEDGPGLRWLAGVPDRLIVTLAKMNTLLEDHGNRVDGESVRMLEQEISACATAHYSDPTEDPVLALGRVVVQESWKLVAHIYLYMGLCGADSCDARVVRIRKRFFGLIQGVRPRRNPDTFLVVPLMILGVAITRATDQSIILTRLWGISECSKPDTLGNDMIRMLNYIWGLTKSRPAVWSDVRAACMHITGT